MLPSVLQMEISQSRVSQKNFSLLNDCDRWFLQTMFHSRCSITSHLMHTYFLQKANIMDCHTVLLEILNLLLIWTLDNYGFLDFSVTNFNTDPFVIYSGNVNPIICLLHLFSWIDLSIWLYLKTTYPCWSHTSKKKKIPIYFLVYILIHETDLAFHSLWTPSDATDLMGFTLSWSFHTAPCDQHLTTASSVNFTLQTGQAYKISINAQDAQLSLSPSLFKHTGALLGSL